METPRDHGNLSEKHAWTRRGSLGLAARRDQLASTLRSSSARQACVRVVAQARAGLEALQQADGHWVFELEADATIPGLYVLLEHFLGEIDRALEDRIAAYLRADAGGPWRLVAVCRR